MTEVELISTLLKSLDSAIALAIAVWIINVGLKRLDYMQEQYRTMTETVLNQQQANNDQLMSLVSTLCVQPAPPPPAKTLPKAA